MASKHFSSRSTRLVTALALIALITTAQTTWALQPLDAPAMQTAQTTSATSATRPGNDDAAIHQSLRALLRNLEQAVNAGEYDQLAQYFDAHMLVTPSNQEILSSPDQIKPYFDKWFGANSPLKSVQVAMKADGLTDLNTSRDLGVASGSGTENYTLKDGSQLIFKTRWTATVKREADGQWRILTLHIGTNFLDNPLLDATKDSLQRLAIGAGVSGLIVGFLVGWALRRRKSAVKSA